MQCLHFIFSHSLFVSLCAAALTFHSATVLGAETDPYVFALVFFSTLFTYNVYWIIASVMPDADGFGAFRRIPLSGILTALAAMAGVILCVIRIPASVIIMLPSVFITFLYFLPVMIRNRPAFFLKAGPLKTFLLALAWAYVTVFPVLSAAEFDFSPGLYMLFIQRFFFMLMLCIIFDSRDVVTDKVRQLHSLATNVSRRTLSLIFIFSLLLFIFFSSLLYGNNGVIIHFSVSLLAGISAAALFLASARRRGYLFYYFLVDGHMLLLATSSFFCLFFD